MNDRNGADIQQYNGDYIEVRDVNEEYRRYEILTLVED
jgi:hypothetical protein